MRNYEKIQKMSVEAMAIFINSLLNGGIPFEEHFDVKAWLESEEAAFSMKNLRGKVLDYNGKTKPCEVISVETHNGDFMFKVIVDEGRGYKNVIKTPRSNIKLNI